MAKPAPLSELDLHHYRETLRVILREVAALDRMSEKRLASILRRHPRDGNGVFSKNHLVAGYRLLSSTGVIAPDEGLLRRIQMRPVRTLSGVTPVTVLTKPFPCPGQCIFCPTDARMPKSYLRDEPGAMRAEQHGFDPYEQTAGRIAAFESNGHPADKIELLVLGGTWSSYPREYQEYFVRRCLDAMNDATGLSGSSVRGKTLTPSTNLPEAQRRNESARCRNVGLVLETRPDHVTLEEIRHLRHLGATKIQMGAQSLDDRILRLNQRGHTVEQTRGAMARLRTAGFKLVLHWMPNLHGAAAHSDLEDFQKLFEDPGLRPDEIKIYPTTLLKNAALYQNWLKGNYEPYDDDTLIELIIACKELVPRYCRINRIYRDIPSTNVVAGCKITNLRQRIAEIMKQSHRSCHCLRCREVRSHVVDTGSLSLNEQKYHCRESEEVFLSFDDPQDRCAGYLRLSLPETPGFSQGQNLGLNELEGCALVREVHVYGPALQIGRDAEDSPAATRQHRGLGRRLLVRAEELAQEGGYPRMAVIASVGTRAYYRRRGYALQGTYMIKNLHD